DPPAGGELDGKVVAESGEPVAGVTVITKTPTPQPQSRTTTTDADGHFHFANPAQILQFRKDEFRPHTQLVDLSLTSTIIVLHDSKISEWTVKTCSPEQLKEKRVGDGISFELPSGAKVRKEGGKKSPLTNFITYGLDRNGLRLVPDAGAGDTEPPGD